MSEVVLTVPTSQVQVGKSLRTLLRGEFRSNLGLQLGERDIDRCVDPNAAAIALESVRSVDHIASYSVL
jgi:hypothetical protein